MLDSVFVLPSSENASWKVMESTSESFLEFVSKSESEMESSSEVFELVNELESELDFVSATESELVFDSLSVCSGLFPTRLRWFKEFFCLSVISFQIFDHMK